MLNQPHILAPKQESPEAKAEAVFQQELVAIFSDVASLFGMPPSIGAIYGLLFCTEHPLTMEEIIDSLLISKGSASQGLRQLEELGAISREKGGERFHTFSAHLELKPLLGAFLRKRLAPRLSNGSERLKNLQKMLDELPASYQPVAEARLQRITKWHRRAANFLPLAQRLLRVD